MLLKKTHLVMVTDHAKREMLAISSPTILDGGVLTPQEVLALAYFNAVCQVLGSMGIDTSMVQMDRHQDLHFSLESEESDRFGKKE